MAEAKQDSVLCEILKLKDIDRTDALKLTKNKFKWKKFAS